MDTSPSYLGSRGHKLSVAQIFLAVAPAFFLFGYNQSGVGGLLSVTDWTKTFPEIDTIHTHGHEKSQHSTLQSVVVLLLPWEHSLVPYLVLASEIYLADGNLNARRQRIVGSMLFWMVCLSASVVFQQHGSILAFFQIKTGSIPWRLPLAIPSVVSMLLMSVIFFLPESPRWLLRVSRREEAIHALSALKDLPPTSAGIAQEISAIESTLEQSSHTAAKLSDIFTMGEEKLFYRFMLCIFLQLCQQMSGGNLISVYSTVIFQENLGLPSQTSRILSGGTLTWKFLSCFVAFFTVDRFGRRALLMVSGAGMALCMLSLCIATSFGTENKSAGIAAVFFIYMFNFFIPIGFLGANFLYCTDVAPIRLRVAMASISTANHWLWNLVVTLITPVAIADIGYRYYILYTVIGLCIPVTFYFFYPETMGRSLEELDEAFRSNSSILGIVSASKKLLSQESLVEDDEEKGFSVATLEEVDKKVGL
ncbi:hypothetical protein ONS95_000118 [Cadophora gregata]|uniref:uncharacterized protein n=1 Tax=Cadophora gregata TaxID=51156 RepID=UPI0026DB6DEC|nr:uncharacterized protein ONS95_000118 [Cadophora gregata]KAK0128134.1 hypothetical protein ONS95_000118 [Cadophora gregata]